ncbi:MAG: hypothetical protein IT518_04310 [Burkholderiales bacterium]|nr:hypothetical protein [Burkholderiales bacterium]
MTSRRKFLFAGATALAAPVALHGAGAQATESAEGHPAVKAAVSKLPPQGTILLEDSGSGVSRDYFQYTLKVKWKGSFQGALLGAQTGNGATTVRIPLSGAPETLVLRTKSSWANVYSRESGRAPSLEVKYTDSSSAILACQADATIDPSTTKPMGADTRLQLGVAVLRFAVPAKPVASAALVFQTINTGGSVTFEAYQFLSPILPEPSPVYGLRARGLAGPTLIEATDFNKPNWWHPWFRMLSMMPSAQTVASLLVDRDLDTLAPLDRKAILVETRPAGFPPQTGFPESAAYMFPKNLGKELDEVYFQYRLRFGEGWRGGSMQSGKLPGIASDTSMAGNGGGTANGKNGWSFRGLFVGEPMAASSPYNSNNGVVPIGWYTYNPDQIAEKQLYGLHLPWTGRGSLGLIEIGKDYWIDQYVKVNTPGKKDGIVRAWINGQLAYERTDHVMRDVGPYQVPGNLAIQKVWMTFLHGGDINPLPTKILRTYWSDWTIATEYIGPPAAAASKPPTISIVAPQEGANPPAGVAFPFDVSAMPGGSSISKVDFYRDGALIGTDTSAPYGMSVTGSAVGKHVLMAVVTDSAKNVVYSNPVHMMVGTPVNVPPTVTISAPVANSTYSPKASVGIRAFVTDDESVSKVMFYINSMAFATFMGTKSPYSSAIGGMPPGNYTLKVVATDNKGLTSSATTNFKIA